MANDIKIGNIGIGGVYIGSSSASSVYIGSTLVWSGGTTPPTPSYNYITYKASAKLDETTGATTSGLHTNAFSGSSGQLTMTSHTFENGDGTIRFDGDITSIGQYAFYNCYSLTSIEIPNSVTSIGNYALRGCSGLTSVSIPSGVTSIGNSAFSGCSSLTSIEIPNSVTSIGTSVFNYCRSLTSIDIPSGVTSIGQQAFQNCSSLTSIEIPNSVTGIGTSAFYQCSGLTSCTIGSGVTSIGGSVLRGGKSLTSVTVLAITPPSLGSASFNDTNDCPIYVPSGSVDAYKAKSGWSTYASRIQAIPTPTFQGKWLATYTGGTTSSAECDSTSAITQNEITYWHITSIEIGDCVTTIGDAAFESYNTLTSCTIGNNVTTIGDGAFSFCLALSSVTIPNSVTSLGVGAFGYCSGLTSVTIGNGVTSIGESAFDMCTNLSRVEIGSGVTNIGQGIFYFTNESYILICHATTPPTLDDHIFDRPNGGIYVPDDSVNAYKIADVWSTYAQGIFPISDLPN